MQETNSTQTTDDEDPDTTADSGPVDGITPAPTADSPPVPGNTANKPYPEGEQGLQLPND